MPTETLTLLEETHQLLSIALETRSMMVIALSCDLNYFWLRKFHYRTIKNPGIKRVELLHKKLLQGC